MPRGPRAKSPLTDHLDFTRDPAQIAIWWSRWPHAMIGAAVPDSLIVIDIDPRNGGSLEALEALVGALPQTLTVWSGRGDGGRHIYFLRPLGELTGTRLPAGIDLKVGGKGYCILPPSMHPATGRPYRWDNHRPVDTPAALRAWLLPPPRKAAMAYGGGSRAADGLLRTVVGAKNGRRNSALFWASCRAVEKGLIDRIGDDLVAAALSIGLTEPEARKAVNSARRTVA